MRRFTDTTINTAVAAAYKDGKRPTLPQLAKSVRRAGDSVLTEAGRKEPLTIDEWAEVCALFAAQAHGARVRDATHDDIAIAWEDIVSTVDRHRDGIEHRRKQRADELAAQAGDPYGTEPMPFEEGP